MVWRIPNLLRTRRCRINLETGIEMGLAGEVGEYALSHSGTADVAVADEKYLYHLFKLLEIPNYAQLCPIYGAF